MTDNLPPLPTPARITLVQFCDDGLWFTAEQMQDSMLAAAPQPVAQPGERWHVGDSAFESWFASYSPAGKGDKQRARDAYAAGRVELEQVTQAKPEQAAQPTEQGWLIANGKNQGEGLAYRFINNDWAGMSDWTEDQDKAIRFARREDAEQFAHHDEDAWRVVAAASPKPKD